MKRPAFRVQKYFETFTGPYSVPTAELPGSCRKELGVNPTGLTPEPTVVLVGGARVFLNNSA